jgi:toxin ParE1/3/4
VATPGIGGVYERAPESMQGLRVSKVVGFKNHLIFYRIGQGMIEVVRVVHGARDLDELLGST